MARTGRPIFLQYLVPAKILPIGQSDAAKALAAVLEEGTLPLSEQALGMADLHPASRCALDACVHARVVSVANGRVIARTADGLHSLARLSIYTDGSAADGAASWAFVVIGHGVTSTFFLGSLQNRVHIAAKSLNVVGRRRRTTTRASWRRSSGRWPACCRSATAWT